MWRRWRGLGVLVGALVASLVLAPATSIGLQRVVQSSRKLKIAAHVRDKLIYLCFGTGKAKCEDNPSSVACKITWR